VRCPGIVDNLDRLPCFGRIERPVANRWRTSSSSEARKTVTGETRSVVREIKREDRIPDTMPIAARKTAGEQEALSIHDIHRVLAPFDQPCKKICPGATSPRDCRYFNGTLRIEGTNGATFTSSRSRVS